VAVLTVVPQPLLLTTELPGRTAPFRIAEIRPQVNGLILKRLFTEGSDVQAGQLLYEIDPAPFKAAQNNAMATLASTRKAADRARSALNASLAGVDQQQATVAFARTNRKRFEDLLKEKAVSASDCEHAVTEANVAEAGLKAAEAQAQSDRDAVAAAEADIQQAEAALETTRINLGYTRITAPISGRIGTSAVTDGAIVTAYQSAPLATLQQMDPIYVDAAQSTVELQRLQQRLEGGQMSRDETNANKVKLLLDDGTSYPLEGTLQFRDVSVNPTTGSVILRMVFPNPNGKLLPNMFVRAVVNEGVSPQAILIPQQTVTRNPKGEAVALIVGEQDKVQQRVLTLDRSLNNQWLVSSGLRAGDRVIAEGVHKAKLGSPVKVVALDPASKPAAPSAPKVIGAQ
jgi:membrane fusion protein (multidrug efflux system)